MDRFSLECFVAVAEELHFHRAAERCHISQPAISQQFRRLERELDVQLAHRTNRSVSLTAAGEVFLDDARKILRQMDSAATRARSTDRGEVGQLVIGATSPALFVLLPEALVRFRELSPHVGITARELTAAEQERALHAGEIDVGLVHPPLDDPALVAEEVARVDFKVALPADHRLARQDALELQDLAGEPFVMFPRTVAPQLYDTVLGLCHDAGFSLRVVAEAHPAQSIIALVAARVGLGFIASSVQQLDRSGVIYRSLDGPRPHMTIGVAHHPRESSPVIENFVEAARRAGRDTR